MRLTVAIFASLLFVANTAVSYATIIVTPVTFSPTPALGATTQQFTMRLRMTSDASDSVAQYAFNVALSTAAGPISYSTPLALTGIATGLGFGGEYSQTNTAITGANSAFLEGQPGGGSPFTFTSDSLAFNGAPPATPGYFRERELTFAVNRPLLGSNRDILVTITPATITGTALNSFRNAAGAALPTNFGAGLTVVGGTIIAVPEPTSIALVALVGGIAAGARLRTRKTKKKSFALEV